MVRLAVLWSAFAGRFLFAVRFEVRGGSVLSALYEVLAILSASYLAFLVGFRLTSVFDVRLGLVPFDIFIIVYLRKYINMQIAQVFT